MIIAATYDLFKLYGTDTFELNLNWKDGDGNLFDLTGWNSRMRLFISKTDYTMIKEVTNVVDDQDCLITLGDGSAEPNISVYMPDEAVVLLDSPPGFLTLEVETPGGDWGRLLQGKIKFEK